jgi:hypothetical protein
MSRKSVRASALASAVTLASLFGLAGPAMAQGGSPPPAPAPVALDCTKVAPADPNVAINYAGDAGCVGIRVSGPGLRLAWVVVAKGWTYVVKSNGTGTNSRVELRFTNAATGQKVNFRYERGKTVIG